MYDIQVTRFKNGVNNTRDNALFSDLPALDYSVLHDFMDDLDYWSGPVAAGTTNGYSLTGTGATAALAVGDGGILNVIGATTGFAAALQRATGSFQMTSGYRAWFETIASLSTLASAAQILTGLTNVTGTPFTGGQITDGVWFQSDNSGNGVISFNVAVNGTTTSVNVGANVVAGSQATFKWYYDGNLYGKAANGMLLYEITGPGVSANVRGELAAPTNFGSRTTNLAPIVATIATAGTPTIGLDLWMMIKERVNSAATPAF